MYLSMSYHAGREEECLPASFMEWSVTMFILGAYMNVTMVFFNQHLDHFKAAMAA